MSLFGILFMMFTWNNNIPSQFSAPDLFCVIVFHYIFPLWRMYHIRSSNSPIWFDTVSNSLLTGPTEVLHLKSLIPISPQPTVVFMPSPSSLGCSALFDLVENTHFQFLEVMYFSWSLSIQFWRVNCYSFCLFWNLYFLTGIAFFPHFLFFLFFFFRIGWIYYHFFAK